LKTTFGWFFVFQKSINLDSFTPKAVATGFSLRNTLSSSTGTSAILQKVLLSVMRLHRVKLWPNQIGSALFEHLAQECFPIF
jgi:hypothetical protein